MEIAAQDIKLPYGMSRLSGNALYYTNYLVPGVLYNGNVSYRVLSVCTKHK